MCPAMVAVTCDLVGEAERVGAGEAEGQRRLGSVLADLKGVQDRNNRDCSLASDLRRGGTNDGAKRHYHGCRGPECQGEPW